MTSLRDERSIDQPQLAQGLQIAQVGSRTAIIVGGAGVMRFDGPQVSRLIIPVLRQLDGNRSVDELLDSLPQLDRDEVFSLLDDLTRAGLIVQATSPSRGETNLFISRFAGLSESGGKYAPDLEGTEVELVGETDSLCSLRAGLTRDGVNVLKGQRLEWSSQTGIEIASTRIGGFKATLWKVAGSNHRFQVLVESVAHEKRHYSYVLKDDSVAAILAHWLLLQISGFRSGDKLCPSIRSRARQRDLKSPSVAAEVAKSHSETGSLIILRFAVGYTGFGLESRRICPSAGGLGAVKAFWLSRHRHEPMRAFAYDAVHDRCDPISASLAHDLFDLRSDDRELVLLVAARSRLERRYGANGRILAGYDAGAAVEHIRRAALAVGRNAGLREIRDFEGLIRSLHLDSRTAMVIAAVAIGPGQAPRHSDLRALINRRSHRNLAASPVPLSILNDIEKGIDIALQPSSSVAPILCRFALASNGFYEIAIQGADEKLHPAAICEASKVAETIPQANLRPSPLVYVTAEPYALEDERRSERIQALSSGSLLTSLWLQADACGMRGTLCGGVSASPLLARHGLLAGPIALCLGSPRGTVNPVLSG